MINIILKWTIESIKLTPERLDYFHNIAKSVAKRSHDPDKKVGSLLINEKTGAILGTGFNGFVRGAPDCSLPTTRPEKYEFIQHSERNLLYNCLRNHVPVNNCIVYCTLSPCADCIRAMWQCGIQEIYFKSKYRVFIDKLPDINVHLTKIGKYYRMYLINKE